MSKAKPTAKIELSMPCEKGVAYISIPICATKEDFEMLHELLTLYEKQAVRVYIPEPPKEGE